MDSGEEQEDFFSQYEQKSNNLSFISKLSPSSSSTPIKSNKEMMEEIERLKEEVLNYKEKLQEKNGFLERAKNMVKEKHAEIVALNTR